MVTSRLEVLERLAGLASATDDLGRVLGDALDVLVGALEEVQDDRIALCMLDVGQHYAALGTQELAASGAAVSVGLAIQVDRHLVLEPRFRRSALVEAVAEGRRRRHVAQMVGHEEAAFCHRVVLRVRRADNGGRPNQRSAQRKRAKVSESESE
mgnify:CR=1 FL=1